MIMTVSDKPITTNDSGYSLLNWVSVFFVLATVLIGWIFSYNNMPIYLQVILTIVGLLFSIYVASFFFSNKRIFYNDRIVSKHSIKYPVNRDKTINNAQIKRAEIYLQWRKRKRRNWNFESLLFK